MLPMMAGLVGGATGGGFLLSYTGTLPDPGPGPASPRVTVGMYLLSRLNVNATQGESGPRHGRGSGIGLGFSNPVFNVISLNAVPRHLVSSATRRPSSFIRQIGGVTLGLAVLGTIFAQNYKSNLVSAMTPAQQAAGPGHVRRHTAQSPKAIRPRAAAARHRTSPGQAVHLRRPQRT